MAKPCPLPRLRSGTRVREAAPEIVGARLADARDLESKVERRLDADAVHDMRVACRRLRVGLDLLGAPRAVGTEVRRLQDALGAVRDVQVQSAWLARATRSPARRSRAPLDALSHLLKAQLPARAQRLKEELARWRTATVGLVRDSGAGRACPLPDRRFGGRHFRRRLRRRLKNLGELFEPFERAPNPTEAHRLRITAKKVRYEAELLQSVWPAAVRSLLSALVPLQDEFGELHDADVRISMIEQIAGGRRAAPPVRALLREMRAERARLAAAAQSHIGAWRAQHLIRTLRRQFSERDAL